MNRLAIISLSLAAVMATLPARAQEAANACWNAVTREARGTMNTTNISRVSNTVQPMGGGESLVSGTGRADGRAFSYRCTYNARNGRAYAVSLSRDGERGRDRDFGGGPGFGGNRPIDTGDARRAAERGCYDATLRYAQLQYPTASNFKIFLSQNRYAQQSNVDIRVTGQGELRQIDRLRVTWTYSCTYNARTGRVRDIDLSNFTPNR